MIFKFNYNLLNKIINYELANLTEENMKLGSTSTILKVKPSYIIPSGEIYYTTTNHYGANFYQDMDKCFEEIYKTKDRPSIVSGNFKGKSIQMEEKTYQEKYYILDDEIILDNNANYDRLTQDIYDILCKYFNKKLCYKELNEENWYLDDRLSEILKTEKRKKLQVVLLNFDTTERINKRYINYLESRKNEIVQNGITEFDNSSFINHHCLPMGLGAYKLKNLYTTECKNLIISIIDAKLEVYRYFKRLLFVNNNPVEALKNYPSNLKNKCDMYQDFCVQTIGFDKIESQLDRTITTSKKNIYETFFNYLIMDFDIVQIPQINYNQEQQKFVYKPVKEYLDYGLEREYQEEVKLIKKYIPYNQRHLYFK